MKTLCEQYKKAKANKLMLFYEKKYNRWLVANSKRFCNFAKLIMNEKF